LRLIDFLPMLIVAVRLFQQTSQLLSTMPMNTRLAVATLAFVLLVLSAAQGIGAEWPLVTPAEEARDNAAPHAPQSATPAVSGAPVITVKQPNVSRPLRNPTTFDIQFSAARGATINRSTLRVKNGWLGIDITQRLLEHATWTASGLFAADADVPRGNHRISVSIADNLGSVGTRVANLNVLK
jgi:hypothetical protein